MKTTRLIIFVSGVLLLTACTKVVTVHKSVDENTSKEVHGIPFYVKKEKIYKSSTYSQTWYEISLIIEKLEKLDEDKYRTIDTYSKTKIIEKNPTNLARYNAIKGMIKEKKHYYSQTDINDTKEMFEKISTLEHTNSVAKVELSRTTESKTVVDTKEKYYMNAPMWLFTKGTLTQELNPDGTLSKVTAEQDSAALAENIASLIPLKDLLSNRWIKSDATPEKIMSQPQVDRSETKDLVYEISLGITEKGYMYTLIRECSENSGCNYPTIEETELYVYKKESIDIPKSSKGNDSANDNSIGFSGKISLPKE